jgi:prefoldin subunit 4
MGEAFFYLSLIAAKKQLRADSRRYDKEIGGLNNKVEECEKGMKELKVLL